MFILRKVKSLILWVLRVLRRAFCCFRIRSNSEEIDDTSECLTHIEIDSNRSKQDGWTTAWGEEDTPRTVEEHIQSYREKLSASPPADPNKQELENLFQELEPQVIKQKRVVIATDKTTDETANKADLSRLSAINNFSSELGEWMDESSSGWDEQQLDPTDLIRQQKRYSHSRNKLQSTKLAA